MTTSACLYRWDKPYFHPQSRRLYASIWGDVRDLRLPAAERHYPKRDAAKMKPVRILTQPVVKLILPIGADGVTDLPAEGVELNPPQRFWIEPCRQWRAMPSPL